jgi:MYXO-CTERM domain-containing protein
VTVTFTAHSGGGGGGGFGGQATPFAPTVLAKFGKAITWDPKAKTPHDADAKVVTTSDANHTETAAVDITAAADGTSPDTVFLQIANTGESDGSYDSVALAFDPVGGNGDDPLPPPGDAAAPTETTTDSGCACSTPGTPGSMPGTLGGIFGTVLAFGAVARRRRR